MRKKNTRKRRESLIQARVNIDELREILTKAHIYTYGEISEFIRMACLEFRPLKRVGK
jgi:hypothetical protein